jgi:lysine 2,3-aminomutase
VKKIKNLFNSNPDFAAGYSDWHEILSDSIVSADQLSTFLPVNNKEVKKTAIKFPMRINPYYLSLISKKGDPIWKQAVPDIHEIDGPLGSKDPLMEEVQSPVPNLTHRYPDRVLFMISNKCGMYCRFCLRKRKVGLDSVVTEDTIRQGIEYIRKTRTIHDVILSGGDPLLLEDDTINKILKQVRKAPHVKIIRIHTRVPCILPQRVTTHLANVIKKFHPIFINTHFNHPDEITNEAEKACAILADAGIPLGCQTVLLKGINDDPTVMKFLMKKLLMVRVKPYYIHHCDPVKGACHFGTSVKCGINIIKALRGHISGMCVPQYMIDLPGGGGKVPILPEYVKNIKNDIMKIENYRGETFEYPIDGVVKT